MAPNCKDIDEPSGVEVKLRFTVCISDVNGLYVPLYEPPHVNIGFVVGVGDGVGGGGNVSVGVGVTSGVGV